LIKYRKGDDKIDTRLENLIEENSGLIYKLARSLSNKNIEDLYQVGVIGLINAYNNYDDSYNTKFSTYAYPFILGEIKKYIRENKGIKVSRDIIYLSSRLDKLIELLTQKYRRMPTIKELSIETGIDEWKIIEALDIKNSIKSLDEPINCDGKTILLGDMIHEDSSFEEDIETNEILDKLNEDEKRIIIGRYYYDRSQSEMAEITGYSQAKVSRNEKKILKKLRNYYKTS